MQWELSCSVFSFVAGRALAVSECNTKIGQTESLWRELSLQSAACSIPSWDEDWDVGCVLGGDTEGSAVGQVSAGCMQ